MPAFLEEKLKRQYGANSKIPFKVMNSIGAMHGNKETMQKKHERKMLNMGALMRGKVKAA